jgi:hypothetical protein
MSMKPDHIQIGAISGNVMESPGPTHGRDPSQQLLHAHHKMVDGNKWSPQHFSR